MIPKDRRVKGADIQSVRELLGVTNLDIFWLLGTQVPTWRTTGEEGQETLAPALSILLRYLATYPEETFLPQFPSLENIFPLVEKAYPGKMSARRFGTIWGMSGWTGNAWFKGENPSQGARRLFKLVGQAIETQGEEGLSKFLEIVDIEARARGIEGGLEAIMRKGSWGVREEKEAKEAQEEE